jgi:hypothetical protein
MMWRGVHHGACDLDEQNVVAKLGDHAVETEAGLHEQGFKNLGRSY